MANSDLPDDNKWASAAAHPVSTQAAFNAAWDLLTRWRRGARVSAESYGVILASDIFALPEVMYALVAAEQRARREAGEPPREESFEWLYAALPGRGEVYSRLVEFFASSQDGPPEPAPDYSYLEAPIISSDLGRLGHYRVIREIGRGGMGVVFEVENTVLKGSRRALKLLEPSRCTPTSRERFVREARAMEQIKDNNVVQVKTAGEVNGITYLEMEYVYGPTLEDLIRYHLDHPAPLPLAADLIRQTASGLAAAHDHPSRLAHRDVKPGNILLEWMLEDDGYPFGWRGRVCDFGLTAAADQTRLTQEGAITGTPRYLAPEQFTQESNVDGRKCDIFALGVIAYELVTGRHPFKGDTQEATIGNIRLCEVEPPRRVNRTIPKNLEQLIMGMLERLPDKRPTAQDVTVELSKLLGLKTAPTAASPKAASGLSDQPLANESPDKSAPGEALGKAGRPAADAKDLSLRPTGSWLMSAAEPLTLGLGVTVWKKEDTSRALSIDDPQAVPLQARDYARLEIWLNRPAYVYVVQLEASGDIAPLYPWRNYDWGEREAEKPLDRLNQPQDPLSDGAPLMDGPSGIEAFVVFAREEPLGEEEAHRLRSLFAISVEQGQFDPSRGVVWIGTAEDQNSVEADRARLNMGAARQLEDPVARVRRVLWSDEVRSLSQASRGVCYPFVGQ